MDGQPDFSLPFPHSGTLAFINAESVSLHVHHASEISRISLRLLLQASRPTQLVDPLFGLVNGIHEIIDGHSHSVLLLGGLAVRWQLHDTAPKTSRFGKRVLGDFCRIVLLRFRSKFPGRKESRIELLASFDIHSGDLDPARTALRRRPRIVSLRSQMPCSRLSFTSANQQGDELVCLEFGRSQGKGG